jgi:hypothetical protein
MHAYEMSYKCQLYFTRTVATWIFVRGCHIYPQTFSIPHYINNNKRNYSMCVVTHVIIRLLVYYCYKCYTFYTFLRNIF